MTSVSLWNSFIRLSCVLRSLTKVIFIFHDGMVLQHISSYARTAKLVLAKTETDFDFFFPNKSSRMTVRVFLTFFIIYFLKIIKLLHNFQESLKDNPEKNFLKKISSGNPNRPTGSVFF